MKQKFSTISIQVELIEKLRKLKIKCRFHSLGEVIEKALINFEGGKNSRVRRSKR